MTEERRCNGCGRCCEEFSYIIDEEDLINWYYDMEGDNTYILERVTVDAIGEDNLIHVMTGMDFCMEKYDFGADFFIIDISMRRYRGNIDNAFDAGEVLVLRWQA
jgi:ferredoxin